MAKKNTIIDPSPQSDCASCRWHREHNECDAFFPLNEYFGKIPAIPTDILLGKRKHREVIDGQQGDFVYTMDFATY